MSRGPKRIYRANWTRALARLTHRAPNGFTNRLRSGPLALFCETGYRRRTVGWGDRERNGLSAAFDHRGRRADLGSFCHSGSRARVDESGRWRVPKKLLVANVRALLVSGRLKVAGGLLEAAALIRELADFRVTITAKANETFGAGIARRARRPRAGRGAGGLGPRSFGELNTISISHGPVRGCGPRAVARSGSGCGSPGPAARRSRGPGRTRPPV